ncbi:MAG: GxxExxY protein [Chloroflexi bacterium]|nr:MAG: GxxExxY protein [Chloroflexota bacterium]
MEKSSKYQDVNEITRKIIGCAYEVSNTLGIGFVEKVYENALAHLVRKSGLSVAQQHPIKVLFDGIIVGDFYADLLVENRVLVELKAVSRLVDPHTAQSLNYLRASEMEICLLINFGKSKIEIKRMRPSTYWKTSKS